jgi:hypothetical protein
MQVYAADQRPVMDALRSFGSNLREAVGMVIRFPRGPSAVASDCPAWAFSATAVLALDRAEDRSERTTWLDIRTPHHPRHASA